MIEVRFDRRFQPWKCAAFEELADDVRGILRGVCVDPVGCLVSANGFAMSVVPCMLSGKIDKPLVLPAYLVEHARGEDSEEHDPVIRLNDDGTATAVRPDYTITTNPLVGQYPNWRTLFAESAKWSEASKAPDIAMQPELFNDLAAAIGGPFPTIRAFSATGPVYMQDPDSQAIGIIMPMWQDGEATRAALDDSFQRFGIPTQVEQE